MTLHCCRYLKTHGVTLLNLCAWSLIRYTHSNFMVMTWILNVTLTCDLGEEILAWGVTLLSDLTSPCPQVKDESSGRGGTALSEKARQCKVFHYLKSCIIVPAAWNSGRIVEEMGIFKLDSDSDFGQRDISDRDTGRQILRPSILLLFHRRDTLYLKTFQDLLLIFWTDLTFMWRNTVCGSSRQQFE